MFKNGMVLKNRIFAALAAAAIAVTTYATPFTAHAAVRADATEELSLTTVEGTLIQYADNVSQTYVDETVAAYCKLPENVRVSLVKTGTPIYIINHDDIPKLTSDIDISRRRNGVTISYNYPSGMKTSYIVFVADSIPHGTQEHIVFHEVGHYIDRFCLFESASNAVSSSLSDSKEFTDLTDQYLTVIKDLAYDAMGCNLSKSNIKKNRSEMYATTYALYLMYPDKLLKVAPELYNYVAETSGTI